jgi:thioredoxin 1
MIIEIKSQTELDALLAQGKTVLVDFWASWCGPCKVQGPIFAEASEKLSEVLFVKVNVDEAPELAGKFGILSIPTLIVFKSGTEIKREVGVHDLEKLTELAN